jgi:hypothetical protein
MVGRTSIASATKPKTKTSTQIKAMINARINRPLMITPTYF